MGRSDEDATTTSPRSGSSPNKGHRKSFPSAYDRSRERTTTRDISDGAGRLPSSGLQGLSTSPGRRGLHFERTLSEVAEREREPSSPADVLSSANAIDERLRRMNEAFRASLHGLTRRGSSSSLSPSPGSGTPGPSSGDEQKSPASAVEESPTTPLAPLARAIPLEGRERPSALSRYMRMTATPPTAEQAERRSATTPAVLVATQSEDGDGQHGHLSAGVAVQSRRTRSDFDVPATRSGSDTGASGDRQRRAQVPTRIRVVNSSRSSAAAPASGRVSPSNPDSRRASGDRPRPDRYSTS